MTPLAPKWKMARLPEARLFEQCHAQMVAAAKIERELHDYAAEIGCEFFQDEVMATPEQMKLLQAWWEARQ